MRSRSTIRSLATGVALAALAAAAGATAATAKEGSIVTVTTPIPRDAEPGTIINVEFTVEVLDGDTLVPLTGSPVVLKLIGPDGTTTEAMGGDQGRGTYVASIEVPASGIESAEFGLRGSTLAEDGSEVTMDLPLGVAGPVFADEVAPAAAPPAPPVVTTPAPAEPSPQPPVDSRVPIAGILGVLFGVAGLTLAVIGRRRSLRSA